MALDYILYALFAYSIWSFGIILDKILRTKHINDSVILTMLFGISNFILFLFIVPFIKIGFPGIFYFLLCILTGILTLAALIPYFKALSFEDASRVIPLWQTTPLFTLLFAFIFLGERLTLNHYIGFPIILVGGILISIVKIEGVFRVSKAFWLMLLSSISFAVFEVTIKFIYSNVDYWTSTFYVLFGFFISSLFLLFIKNYRKMLKELVLESKIKIITILIVGGSLTGLIGRLLCFLAITLGPISIISVLGGFEPLFVLIYASILSIWLPKILKEEINRKVLFIKIIAMFLMFTGLMFLYF